MIFRDHWWRWRRRQRPSPRASAHACFPNARCQSRKQCSSTFLNLIYYEVNGHLTIFLYLFIFILYFIPISLKLYCLLFLTVHKNTKDPMWSSSFERKKNLLYLVAPYLFYLLVFAFQCDVLAGLDWDSVLLCFFKAERLFLMWIVTIPIFLIETGNNFY